MVQHQRKVAEQNLKALKARNEHRLCIDSANAAIRKFFVDDLPELINVSTDQVESNLFSSTEACKKIKD